MVSKQALIKEVEQKSREIAPVLERLAENGICKTPLNKYCLVIYPPRNSLDIINKDQRAKIINLFASLPEDSETDLYIHIPFCSRSCTFCNFYFEPGMQQFKEKIGPYLKSLEKEAVSLAHLTSNRLKIGSLYIGGGTPSLLNLKYLEQLLSLVFQNYKCRPSMEITLEVHPEVTRIEKDLGDYLRGLKKLGITRLSIGQQTTNKMILAKYYRGHNIEEVQEFVTEARGLGFNINVDLMLGFLEQSLDSHYDSLEFVTGLEPDAITTYFLEIRPGSGEFENYKKAAGSKEFKERLIKLSLLNRLFLEQAGYSEKTFSYWFKEGSDFEHRKRKWEGGKSILLSLGPGTYNWIFTGPRNNAVFFKPFDINSYQKTLNIGEYPIERAIIMGEEETVRRHFMFSMRQGFIKREKIDGIPSKNLKKEVEETLRGLVNLGFIRKTNKDFELTLAGKVLRHEIAGVFASDSILEKAVNNRAVEEQKYEWFTNPAMLQKFKELIRKNR